MYILLFRFMYEFKFGTESLMVLHSPTNSLIIIILFYYLISDLLFVKILFMSCYLQPHFPLNLSMPVVIKVMFYLLYTLFCYFKTFNIFHHLFTLTLTILIVSLFFIYNETSSTKGFCP